MPLGTCRFVHSTACHGGCVEVEVRLGFGIWGQIGNRFDLGSGPRRPLMTAEQEWGQSSNFGSDLSLDLEVDQGDRALLVVEYLSELGTNYAEVIVVKRSNLFHSLSRSWCFCKEDL